MSNLTIPAGTRFDTIQRKGRMAARSAPKWENWSVIEKNGPNCYLCELQDSTEYNRKAGFRRTFGEETILAGTKKPVEI